MFLSYLQLSVLLVIVLAFGAAAYVLGTNVESDHNEQLLEEAVLANRSVKIKTNGYARSYRLIEINALARLVERAEHQSPIPWSR